MCLRGGAVLAVLLSGLSLWERKINFCVSYWVFVCFALFCFGIVFFFFSFLSRKQNLNLLIIVHYGFSYNSHNSRDFCKHLKS